MSRLRRWALWLLISSFAGCSQSPRSAPVPGAILRGLPDGVLATVGPMAITKDTVAAVARAQGISTRAALDREIRDALFANAELASGARESLSVETAIRGRLAREQLEELKREAAVYELRDSEVAEATARHFVDLDRPETFRVIHAVIKVPNGADAAERVRAKALAEQVAERTLSSVDADSFRKQAESASNRGNLEMVIESLDPVASDGRVIDLAHPSADPQHYANAFALAASHLAAPGDKSGVIMTEFGYHVMMLIERIPSHVVSFDERKRILRDEILTDRARLLKQDLLDRLKRESSLMVMRNAEALLSTIPL